MLRVDRLCVSYDGIQAVREVSLEVASGEIFALVGPNGAGKSSLLNAISGIVPASAGDIVFEGRSVAGSPAHRLARMGIIQVPEGRRILGPLTVLDNLLLGRQALGGRGRGGDDDLDRVMRLFPILQERRHQPAGQLSGGQQQMLAIGRALMGRPKVLLLDEPSLGLAPVITAEVFRALGELNAAGLTILLVEQNARLALATAHRACVLQNGRVVQSGRAEALAGDRAVADHYFGVG